MLKGLASECLFWHRAFFHGTPGRRFQTCRREGSDMPDTPSGTALLDSSVSSSEANETLTVLPLHCAVCGAEYPPAPVAICERCLGPLEPVYPADRPLPTRAEIGQREHSLWRYREFLPLEGRVPYSLDTGMTPLVESPALARRLGVA